MMYDDESDKYVAFLCSLLRLNM